MERFPSPIVHSFCKSVKCSATGCQQHRYIKKKKKKERKEENGVVRIENCVCLLSVLLTLQFGAGT